MTMIHSFSTDFPGSWRLFNEVEIPTDAALIDSIHTWLRETLLPLNLNDRFVKKILVSAEQSVTQGAPEAVVTANGHIHLLVYTLEDSPHHSQSWGFFRIEQKGEANLGEHDQYHAVAFFLYREGI